MASSSEKGKKQEGNGLVDVVFSWTLQDILNHNLYIDKVEKIPETFFSVKHYMRSYIYPLIEETHAEMSSSIKILSQHPTCRILSVEEAKGFKQPKNLVYNIIFDENVDDKNKRENYKPQPGDVIALSDVKPMRVNDLNKSRRSYLPAIVVGGCEGDSSNKVLVLASKPVVVERGYLHKKEPLFAIFLTNLTTNIRIWKALHGENLDIIKEVLHADSMVGDSCTHCSSQAVSPEKDVHVHADLKSFDLNESQLNAVLSSIAASGCIHKNSVRLIWGPPGTGKTKTIATLLWGLLKLKRRTLTCAPTNIAVVEVTSCVLKLVRESTRHDCYGLGDMVLFGNGNRMKIDDDPDGLLDVFLDYRVERLAECFSIFGWKHQFDLMICLLKDHNHKHVLYLENRKKRKDEKIEEGLDQNKNSGEKGETCDDVLTIVEFVRIQFGSIEKDLRFCIRSLCTHLPTSFISRVGEIMNRVLVLLESIGTLLHSDTLTSEELKEINLHSISVLSKNWNELLQILISLRGEFSVPDFSNKSSIKNFCLENACLIFSTASSSANLHELKPLEMLVIDEAAQLKECESTIPLQLPGVRHAILIGDECQLPAMVKSKMSEKAEFGRSLFERLVSLGRRKHLLNIQYRMHPSISLFPNSEFYDKRISDAPNVKERSYTKNFLQGSLHGSYSFINVAYGKEGFDNGHSPKNMVEVAIVSELVASLFEASIATKQKISVGVISPYNSQVFALNNKLGDKYGTHGDFSVSIRSVDGFQGGEEDVIIISTVRSNENGSVGFLSKLQRTNVALTRARYCLWILGNDTTLVDSGSVWKKLVLDAKDRGCFFNADEDKRLFEAIIIATVKLHQFDDLLKLNSRLFRWARWKVIFGDGFWISMGKIKKEESLKKAVSLLMRLPTGWRHPLQNQRDLNITDWTSSQMLEQYEVDEMLYLLWTVDVLKESSKCTQVLKFWDILPLLDVPKLAKRLNVIFGNYTVDDVNRCKLKRLEGELEVPMSWEINSDAVGPNNIQIINPVQLLSSQLSSLNLEEEP